MNIVTTIVLIIVFALMLIMPYFTQKKKNQEYMNMLSSIKVGDLVKTAGGIIGKVNKISDKGEIKTIVLETGSKSEKSYLEMDISMIYCVLKSTKNADSKEDEKDSSVETETEELKKVDEIVETEIKEVNEENKTEEQKKARKPRTSTKGSIKSKAKKN